MIRTLFNFKALIASQYFVAKREQKGFVGVIKAARIVRYDQAVT